MRRFGATDKDGNPVKVEAGKTQKVPMKYRGTTLLVRASEGQIINPEKEYMRQLGINKKQLKKKRAKERKLKINN